MNNNLEIHNNVLEKSVAATHYSARATKFMVDDLDAEPNFFLDDLEKKANEQNIMFAVYQQLKEDYSVRATIDELKPLFSDGSLSVSGINLSFDKDNGIASINDKAVPVTPLFQDNNHFNNMIDATHKKQRHTYLTENISNQRMFISFDSKGHTDLMGNEINTDFNQKKVNDALRELEIDHKNINPNGIFKAEMTASQKMRYMLTYINDMKATISDTLKKMSITERLAIEQPLFTQQNERTAKGVFEGTMTAADAMKQSNNHEIDARHHFVQNALKGVDGLNDTSKFAISQLKPIPAGYVTHEERLNALLDFSYGDDDSDLAIVGKQLEVFANAKEQLINAPSIDFSHGIDLDRLMVSTKTLAGSKIGEGKSAIIDSSQQYHNVKAGEFALPRDAMINQPFNQYKLIAVTVGATAAGAISNALMESNSRSNDVLVIDALDNINVTDVLAKIRTEHKMPIAVFTDSKPIDTFLRMGNDDKLSSNLSQGIGWGERGIDALKNGTFDDYERLITSKIESTYRSQIERVEPVRLNAELTQERDNMQEPIHSHHP